MPPKTIPLFDSSLRAQYLDYLFGNHSAVDLEPVRPPGKPSEGKGTILPFPQPNENPSAQGEWILTRIMRTPDGRMDGERFFQLNAEIAPELDENRRLLALNFWLNMAQTRYSKGDFNISPAESILALEESKGTGICTDINISFGSKLASSLGFEPAGMTVWPRDAKSAHTILLLRDRGSRHNYVVDYGASRRLSDDWSTACEQVFMLSGRFVPFSLSIKPSTAFYSPQSERALLNAIGWFDDKVRSETGLEIGIDSHGSKSVSTSHSVKSFTFACFALQTPFSLSQAYGGRASLLLEDAQGNRRGGVLWLPQLDLAVMSAKTGESFYDLEMLRLTPLSYSLFPSDHIEVRAIPLRLELAASALNLQPSAKAGSELGFIVHGDGFNQYSFKVLSAYGANPQRFYQLYKPSVALGYEAGLRQGGTQVRAGYYPGALIEQGRVEAGQKFALGKNLDFLMAGEVSFQDERKVWRMSGQLSLRLP